MAFELRQQQKLSQQLVFTLQMQQAIKLLQLNHQEMVDMVKTELVENPALEEVPEASAPANSSSSNAHSMQTGHSRNFRTPVNSF